MKKIIKDLEILDYATEGKAMGKLDGKVYFSPNTVPGDIVDLRLVKKRSSFSEGRVIKYHRFSEKRIDPFCKHFELCGGCQWQSVSYSEQLVFKENQVGETLRRIGGLEKVKVEPIVGSPLDKEYRNKMEFSFSNSRWLTQEEIESGERFDRNALGFHIPGRYDKVLDLNECHLQDLNSNRIRNRIRSFARNSELPFYDIHKHEGFWRIMMLRNNSQGEWLLHFQFGYQDEGTISDLAELIKTEFPEITSACYSINQKKNDSIYDLEIKPLIGDPFIFETLGTLKFKIGPKAFFQTNLEQTKNLYQKVLEYAQFKGDELVWDLYSGVGSISLSVAGLVRKVIGIETVEMAVENARENAEINGITNAEFISGDVKDLLANREGILEENPSIVILDPPREGLHKDVCQALIDLKVEKIIYVSCKVSTQARDIKLLSESYEVQRIQPVDMFPHTHHVECVVSLELKG